MKVMARMLNGKVMWTLSAISALFCAGVVAAEPGAGASVALSQGRLSAWGQEDRLTVNDFSLWSDWYGQVWASVSVKDSNGDWMTGLTLDDFELTEALISPSQEVIQQRTITFDEPLYQFDGPGFWKRSVTGEKLDIVFAIDSSGSMDEEMPGIVSGLHDFVDRLETNHVDFRIGIIKYDWDVSSVDDSFNLPFQGVMEAQEFHEWLDEVQATWGEWLEPGVGYDVAMFASQLDFRPDAREVIVVISDSLPQTVYGSYWYLTGSTAANMSAVEIVLENSDVELFYCQPDDLEHVEYYGREDFNPRALNTGFDALETLGLAQRIPWPFQQEDIAITSGEIVGSLYYFAWMSGLEEPDEPQNYTVRVTIKVADPEHPGEVLEKSFSYAPYINESELVISVTDETGEPLDDVSVYLYREMGDRKEYLYHQLAPKGGELVEDVPVGDYYLVATDAGEYAYAYTDLRYIKREHITVPPEGLALSLQVETADKEIEFAKARGLLKDLKSWGYCEKPFAQFAEDALSWLDSVENGGVDLKEMEAVKRFYMALSGYVNTTGYAEVEVERAVEDFIQGSKEVRKLLEDLTGTGDDLTERLLDPSTLTLLATYTALLQQEAIDTYVSEEAFTQTLVDYVKGPLIREVVAKVIDLLPARSGLKNVLGTLVETILFGKWDDTAGVLQSMASLALDAALDEAKAALQEAAKQALLDALDSLTDVPEQARAILRAAMSAFFDRGFEGWDDAFLNEMENLAGDAIAQMGGKDRVVEELDNAFLKLQTDGQVGSGPLRDFILPIAQMVAEVCVENYQGGKINDDFVIEVVARLFCNWMALRPLYSGPLLDEMNESLRRAEHFTCEAGDRWDRYVAMSADFGDFRSDIMYPLNEDAWDALELQDSIDDWEDLLSGVELALNGLEATTAIACAFYPAFCDKVDDIHDLISLLEGLRVMTNILQFGLKLDNMVSFRERTQYINSVLLPKYVCVTSLLHRAGAGIDITWRCHSGKSYRVQYKNTLFDLDWVNLSAELLAISDTASWTDTSAPGTRQRFYRVLEIE
jgi:hypothetical protein